MRTGAGLDVIVDTEGGHGGFDVTLECLEERIDNFQYSNPSLNHFASHSKIALDRTCFRHAELIFNFSANPITTISRLE